MGPKSKQNLINRMKLLTVNLGSIALIVMMVLTLCEIFMRYFFNSPIFGVTEIIQTMLGISVFSGMFAVTLERGHVSVSLFERFINRIKPNLYDRIFDIFTLIGTVLVTAILGWRVWELNEYPENSTVLELPMVLSVGALCVLSALTVWAAIHVLRNPDSVPKVSDAIEETL